MKKKSTYYLTAISLVSMVLCGCNSSNDNNNSSTTLQLQQEISQLQQEVNSLSQLNMRYALFTPNSKGYSTIHTPDGNFLVSLQSIKKYANGYKATFQIGNPNIMTFNDMQVNVTWGKIPQNEQHPSSTTKSSFRSATVHITKPLLPGVWNTVSVILSPATPSETGIVALSLKPDLVYLSKDFRKT